MNSENDSHNGKLSAIFGTISTLIFILGTFLFKISKSTYPPPVSDLISIIAVITTILLSCCLVAWVAVLFPLLKTHSTNKEQENDLLVSFYHPDFLLGVMSFGLYVLLNIAVFAILNIWLFFIFTFTSTLIYLHTAAPLLFNKLKNNAIYPLIIKSCLLFWGLVLIYAFTIIIFFVFSGINVTFDKEFYEPGEIVRFKVETFGIVKPPLETIYYSNELITLEDRTNKPYHQAPAYGVISARQITPEPYNSFLLVQYIFTPKHLPTMYAKNVVSVPNLKEESCSENCT